MKKNIIVFVLFVIVGSIYASDVGLGLDFDISTEKETADSYSDATYYSVELGVYTIFQLNDDLEVSPFLSFKTYKEEDKDNLDSDIDTEYAQNSFSFGSGLYFHLIDKKIVNVAVGPKVGITNYFKPTGSSSSDFDSFSHIVFDSDLDIVFDLKLGEKFVFRTTLTPLRLEYSRLSYEYNNFEYTDSSFYLNTLTEGDVSTLPMTFGIHYLF